MTTELNTPLPNETSTDEIEFEFDIQVSGMMARVYGDTPLAPVRGLFGETQNRALRSGSDTISITQGRDPEDRSKLGAVLTIKRNYFGEKTSPDEVFFIPMTSLSNVRMIFEGAKRIA